jgi:hypothetical protein
MRIAGFVTAATGEGDGGTSETGVLVGTGDWLTLPRALGIYFQRLDSIENNWAAVGWVVGGPVGLYFDETNSSGEPLAAGGEWLDQARLKLPFPQDRMVLFQNPGRICMENSWPPSHATWLC